MTYWDMDEYEVEDMMTEFLKKSLAQSEFDPILDRYVFSIHDLQLEYLKSQIDASQDSNAEQELHKHFLDQYFKKVKKQYGLIKDDSYIFYNLGYHLFKSEQFELFAEIYLDLHFVEAMLKVKFFQARSERGSRRLLRERSSEISKNSEGNSLSYTSTWK